MRPTQFLKCSLVVLILVALNTGAPALRAQGAEIITTPPSPLNSTYLTVHTITFADGKRVDGYAIHGPSTPPKGTELQRQAVTLPEPNRAAGTNTLAVPAFDWSFGCSATSSSMIASYYDRNGFASMYTGPTNGGVMPLDSSGWPRWTDSYGDQYGQCPLTASHQGLDGRATRGSIDDYWAGYMKNIPDPYITNSWTQHTFGDAIGDYMKTSQSAYGNDDGSTVFYTWTSNPSPLTCYDMESNYITVDGTYGRKLFYEAKGYTVTDCYNQKTDNNAGGFTFAMYKSEIDAGRPVLLNLAGHSIVGVGYDDSNNTVYIHDTWDYATHSFIWGTSYSNMSLMSVSVVNLASSAAFNKAAPANGETGISLTPTLSWGSSTGATSYEYCYDTTNDNACTPWNSAGLNTSAALSGLANNTTYYWHVRTNSASGTTYSNGSAAAFWSFTTAANPAFNKSAPANGATGVALNPTLRWGASDGATSYEYCYDTSDNNACANWTSATTNTGVVLSGLSYNTTYYWHVRSNGASGTTYSDGSAAAFWHFTTVPNPAFNKTAPANGSTSIALNPTISWGASGGVTSYEYCYDISDNNACANWTSVGLNTGIALTGLSYNTTYYWQVRSNGASGTTYSDGSATVFWHFTTIASPAFNKTAPANGAAGVAVNPTLSWGASPGATGYAYCYDTSDDNACTPWTSAATNTSVGLSGLANNTTYYWHVRATGTGGTTYSNGSDAAFWSFTTLPADTGVTLAINPTTQSAALGQPFTLAVEVRTGTQTVDGAAAYLNFDPAYLQVVSINAGTIFGTVLQSSFDNTSGQVAFTAVSLSNFPFGTFTLATITMNALAAATSTPVVFNAVEPRMSDITFGGSSVLVTRIDGAVTIANTAILDGSITLQGRPTAPNARWAVPLTVTLTVPGNSSPAYTFTPTTDTGGHFSVTGIAPGVYDIRVKGAHTLRNLKTVTLVTGVNSINFGALLEGDANADNTISLLDFTVLAAGYGKCQGTAGFNAMADFNGDICVTLLDFSFLATNYGQGGNISISGNPDPGTGGQTTGTVTINVLPPQSTVFVGDTFTVSIQVQAGSQAMDGVQVSFNFDPTKLQVVQVSGATPSLPLVLQNAYDNAQGTLDFSAGTFSAFPSGSFTLVQITFRAVAETTGTPLAYHHGTPRDTDVTYRGSSILGNNPDGSVVIITPIKLFMPVVKH